MSQRIPYDSLVDDALRGVARRVLTEAAEKGLPGAHHFYISFRTADPGVRVPEYLRSKYTVSFNKQNERLRVPFAAMTAFVDPSVRFGLQFDGKRGSAEEGDKTGVKEKPPITGQTVTSLPAPEPKPALAGPKAPAAPAAASDAQPAEKPAVPPGGAEVVQFDRFRKK
jgi:hypothetical protein